MNEWIRPRVLRLLRVPPEPHPPAGAPGSVKIFRAGKNFYRLRIARWCWKQFWVVIGLVCSISFLSFVRHEAENVHRELERERQLAAAEAASQAAAHATPNQPLPAAPPAAAPKPKPSTAAPPSAAPATPVIAPGAPPTGEKPKFNAEDARKIVRKIPPLRSAENFIAKSPPGVLVLIWLLEIAGIAFFVVQLPFSFAAVKLEYEQHWYIVTDRSLRIRTGLNVMLESTMSFANIQQVVVAQGPLQRLLGLADVRVQSAGGGSSAEHKPGMQQSESLHVGVFRSVENADEIRDLVLARLKQFREAGLGDPEDSAAAAGAPNLAPVSPGTAASASAPNVMVGAETRAAARELLQEARALRQTLAG